MAFGLMASGRLDGRFIGPAGRETVFNILNLMRCWLPSNIFIGSSSPAQRFIETKHLTPTNMARLARSTKNRTTHKPSIHGLLGQLGQLVEF